MHSLSRWARRSDVLWRRVDAGLILLPASTDEAVLLDGVAPAIWSLLEEPVTFDEAVEVLAELYETDPAVVEGDLSAFLESLREMEAVECR